MSHYHLTPDAQADLVGIRHYTQQHWSNEQSQKYLSELQQTLRLLSETPALGKSRPEVGQDVVSFPYASHVIYCVVHEQQLVVFGILHKRMIPINHLGERNLNP